jgi:DNA repair protein RecN (Recombination protein N)
VAFTAAGIMECELSFAANPGEELKPMARVASGGELSRLHLALRTVLRRRCGGPTRSLLFDEVDSGLGGAAAAALAELLAELARHDQVLVVTHLPQVAARAHAQFQISKREADGRAVTRVSQLDSKGREREVARMVAGDEVTEAALVHARELLGKR